MKAITFNRPTTIGNEFEYIHRAVSNLHISGNGSFTKKCQTWLEENTTAKKVLLTHSCTAALEMAAILAEIKPGDEVIMPSFTFVSTANAIVLRGGVPVFVDIRPDTLNIDAEKIEAAITPKTKAVVPVHYAGIACEMDKICDLTNHHGLFMIEDAAQGIMSKFKDKPLGSFGQFSALSFHETKNIISGEGGALLINDEKFVERAEIIWEKGTNRANFFRGQVDKYTWVDIGSSFLPSEIMAAFLWAQFEQAEKITNKRMKIWKTYHESFRQLEIEGFVRRPIIPGFAEGNAHIYYLLLSDLEARNEFLHKMNNLGINTIFHYIPLHSSPAGKKYGRTAGRLSITDDLSDRLVRLPLWIDMTAEDIQRVIDTTIDVIKS